MLIFIEWHCTTTRHDLTVPTSLPDNLVNNLIRVLQLHCGSQQMVALVHLASHISQLLAYSLSTGLSRFHGVTMCQTGTELG